MKRTLMQGAARYVRAENGLDELSEARRFGTKPLLIHGEKAYAAVREALNAVLAEAGITPVLWKNTGNAASSSGTLPTRQRTSPALSLAPWPITPP